MFLKQKVMSGLAWSAASKFLAQLITWAITIVIIRMLTPEDYGLITMAGVFVVFLTMVNEFGLGAAIIQRKELDQDSLRSLFTLVLIAGVLFYVLLLLSAPWIADFFEEQRLISLIRVMALQFLIMGLSVMPQSLLLREMKFRHLAAVDFVSMVAGSVTTLAVAFSGYGVWALVWGALMTRAVSTIGLNMLHPFLFLPSINMRGVWPYLSFGAYVFSSKIMWYAYSRADTLIIGKVLGQDFLGYYAVGLMLAMLPMEKICGLLNQIAFPAFSSVQSESGVLGQHLLKAIRVMSFISFPALWGMSFISSEIIQFFLGDKWMQAALPFKLIALVIPLRMVSNLISPAILGKGRANISLYTSITPLVLMPVAFYAGTFWGLLGVSLAWTIIFPLVFCINLSLETRVLKIRFLDVLGAMLLPLIASLTMYLGLYLVKFVCVFDTLIIKTIFYVFFGILIYSFTTMLINKKGFQEVITLFK